MSDGYQPPPEHPVSGVTHAWNDGRLLTLVIFARVGSWAITRVAHPGREPGDPWLGVPAVTWLGDDHEYGRMLGHFIGFSDQETEILEALQRFDPYALRAAFPGGSPLRDGMYIDTDTIKGIQ